MISIPIAPEMGGDRYSVNHLELFEYSIHRDFYYTADNLTKISEKLEIGKYAKE